MKHKEIRKGQAFDGDIVKATSIECGDILKNRFYKIVKITNNGNAYCKDSKGRFTWINVDVSQRVIGVYTAV